MEEKILLEPDLEGKDRGICLYIAHVSGQLVQRGV